jgi:hypothetical protein
MLAREILDQQRNARENVLVIFSDMHQQTRELDLEFPSMVPSFDRIERKRTKFEVSSLSDVHIRVLGVDDAGKSMPYWQSLREFWIEYFRASGAVFESYTVLRGPVQITVTTESGQ